MTLVDGGQEENFRKILVNIALDPTDWLDDPFFGQLGTKILEFQRWQTREQIDIQRWGTQLIPQESLAALKRMTDNPHAVAAALMPDAHGHDGMPVGSIIALENAIVPGAVGFDIACRMQLSILDLPVPADGFWESESMTNALGKCTFFGGVNSTRGDNNIQPWMKIGASPKSRAAGKRKLGNSWELRAVETTSWNSVC